MSEEQQKQYLEDHPNSRITKIINQVGDKLYKKKSSNIKKLEVKEVDPNDAAQRKLQNEGSPTDYRGPKSNSKSLTGHARKERRIVVMLDKLANLSKLAREKGKEMPDFDLCQVTIPGTNLFCAQHKGIPRKEMPQLKGKPTEGSWADKNLEKDKGGEVDAEAAFKKMLTDEGIKTENKTVDVSTLKATQSQLVGPKIAGMLQALKEDPNHKGINAPIYVSRDGYILDGHHRWAALVGLALADGLPDPVEMEIIEVDMDIEDLVDKTNKFADKIGIAQKAGKVKEQSSKNGCGCGCNDCGKQTASVDRKTANKIMRMEMGDDGFDLEAMAEPSEETAAEYKGKKVTLNKPKRSSDGKKKFYVYVKNDKGNVIKLGFGDPNMEIKRDDPERRKAYRSRHNCDNPGPKWKANYWSCKMWSSRKVSDLT